MITLLASFFFPGGVSGRGTEAGGGCGAGATLAAAWWWGWVALHRVASHCLNHAANYSCHFATIREGVDGLWVWARVLATTI